LSAELLAYDPYWQRVSKKLKKDHSQKTLPNIQKTKFCGKGSANLEIIR
jgi:hypothetical protein